MHLRFATWRLRLLLLWHRTRPFHLSFLVGLSWHIEIQSTRLMQPDSIDLIRRFASLKICMGTDDVITWRGRAARLWSMILAHERRGLGSGFKTPCFSLGLNSERINSLYADAVISSDA